MSRYNEMAERFGLPLVTISWASDMESESLEERVKRLETDLEVDPDAVLPEVVEEEKEKPNGDA